MNAFQRLRQLFAIWAERAAAHPEEFKPTDDDATARAEYLIELDAETDGEKLWPNTETTGHAVP